MSLFGRDLAMDLGTASTRIYAKGRGIVLSEPSAVWRDPLTGKVVGVGQEAASRADGETYWPVNGGLPIDGELTRRMIRHFLRKVHWHPFSRPRLVMAVPDHFTPMEQHALRDLGYEAEARRIVLVQHALAAALGAGLPVRDAAGHMIIDVGCASTRIGVVARGCVVAAGTAGGGGHAVNRAIVRLLDEEHDLLIDEQEAETVKRAAGPSGQDGDRRVTVRGHDRESGRESTVQVPVQEIYEAAGQPVDSIARAAMETVARCPAELAADLVERGAVLVGGGALLRGLGRRLRAGLGFPVRRAAHPQESVVLGLGRCVDDLGLIAKLRRR
ncbi:rod shape-determining protein [Nonomuraea sp. NN258]|uniref:rod shape-determining protein n=1 Tax=Nonomuraea antri TaxID=2730852 RepID=UPI0015694921|nr:rod shape-determining protein [Nonomuraea antri]NRQ33842.1 rod shape-determining protein [Nonomuraea antri]